MKISYIRSVLASAFLGMTLNAVAFNPAVEYATANGLNDDRPFTLGYEFSTSASLTIDALGYWNDEAGNNHQVGIWDTSGNLLVSTTVLGTDPVQGHFQWHAITDFALPAGSYVIGGEFLGGRGASTDFPFQAQGVTTIPEYTYIRDLQEFGAGLNFPTTTTSGYGDNGIIVPNFSVTGGAVPDAGSTAGLLTVAMGFVAALRRRK